MDPHQQWQAVQSHLQAAYAALAAGDRTGALASIEAALAIGPDSIDAGERADQIELATAPARASAPVIVPAPPLLAAGPAAEPVLAPTAPAAGGPSGFEDRVRRRVVDRCLTTARAAIDAGQFEAASDALGELARLAPSLPELSQLSAALKDRRARAAAKTRRRAAWTAIAAMVAILTVFWPLRDPSNLPSPPATGESRRLDLEVSAPPSSPIVAAPDGIAAAPPTASSIPAATPPDIQARAIPAAASSAASQRPLRAPDTRPAAAPTAELSGPPAPPPSLEVVAPIASLVAPPEAPLGPAPAIDERELVDRTLQLYRRAYERLDARLAQAVYPSVDGRALARAFDGLESQSLVFDACDVEIASATASVICRGSSRYVPKVGSREPRVEPRVWTFSLRKDGAEWTIDSAQARR